MSQKNSIKKGNGTRVFFTVSKFTVSTSIMEEKAPDKPTFPPITIIHFGQNTENNDLRALETEQKQAVLGGASTIGASSPRPLAAKLQ